MVVGSLALIYWTSRNLFAPLNIAVMFIVLNYVGCLMVMDLNPPLVIRLVVLVALGIFCCALGALAARWWLHHDPRKELRAFRAREAGSWFNSQTFFTMALYAFIILGMATVVFFFVRAGVPLLSPDVNIAKVEAPRQGGYLPMRFMRLFLPLLLMIYFVGYRRMVRPNRVVAAFAVIFLLVAFTLFGYRGYILNFFLLPFIILMAYQRVSKRTLALLGTAGAASALTITAVAWQETSFGVLWQILSQRIFLAEVFDGIIPIFYRLVPTVGFLHGQGFLMDIPAVFARVGIGPAATENFAQYLARMNLGQNIFDVQAAPTLIGEAYANFGYPGVVAILFLFGFLLQWIYIKTLRGPKDAFFLPLIVAIQHSLLVAAHGPFVFMILDAGGSLLIFTTIFVLLYVFWSLPKGGPRFRKLLPGVYPRAQGAPPARPPNPQPYPRTRWVWPRP